MRRRAAALALTCTSLFLLQDCSTTPNKGGAVDETKELAEEYTRAGDENFRQGRYEDASTYHNLALEAYVRVDHEPGMVGSYNDIGKVNLRLNRLAEAESYFRDAYALSDAIDDPFLLAQSAGFLGELYLVRGEYLMARLKLEEAIGLLGSRNKTPEAAVLLHNIGAVYKAIGELDTSLEHFDMARAINFRLGEHAELAANYYMIASVHSKMGRYEEAMRQAQLALEADKLVENSMGIAQDFLAMALISERSDDQLQAHDYFQRSLRVYQSLDLSAEVLKLLAHLEKSALALDRDDEARLHRAAIDELRSRE